MPNATHEQHGPPPTSFDVYAQKTLSDWKALLERHPAEVDVQKFLEQHPSLVPGARTPGLPSGHYPLHSSLFTQPLLPGLQSRQPDFLWLAKNSQTWYPTLIEIEQPDKPIFTAAGDPRAEFSHARNQLAQWRAWFDDPANVQKFIDDYGIPPAWTRYKTMQLHMILVYGRRREFIDTPRLSKLRAGLLPGSDEELVSYDRLAFDESLEDAITVKALGSGKYSAIAFPEVVSTHGLVAHRLLDVDDVPRALRENRAISPERVAFLEQRLAYWLEWARENRDSFSWPGSGRE